MLPFSKKNNVCRYILASLFLIVTLVAIPIHLPMNDISYINIAYAAEEESGTVLDLAGDLLVAGFEASGISSLFTGFVKFILSIFITIAGLLLAGVGTGFDVVMEKTIVDFNQTFSYFAVGIDAAWAGFRDVSNIIMIAMFVFVAFAVILNIQTYGLKQFGVRILIVAMLINFSLFFTKVIVDVSNITAIQFRKAIQVTDSSGADIGISNIFMQHTGLAEGFLNGSYETLNTISEKKDANNEMAGLGAAFGYTITIVIFFSALAIVLLYGMILMVSRMVMLMILMLTSSAAFAAYMIPGGQKWWDKWWSHLIQNALFAPVFMMMLWGVIVILENMSSVTGQDFTDIAAESTWSLLLNMMIVIGLLYAATQVANNLSIAGAGFAGKMSKSSFSKLLSGSLKASGLGVALNAGLRGRNYVAERTARGLSAVGANETAARFDNMAQNRHIGSTMLGKQFDKAGVSLGKNREKETSKYVAKYETEKEERRNKPATDARNQELKDQNSKGVEIMREHNAEMENLTKEKGTKEAKIAEDLKTADSAHSRAQSEKSKLEKELEKEIERKDDKNLSGEERFQAQKNVQAKQGEIGEQDEKIKDLRKTIALKEKQKRSLETQFSTEKNSNREKLKEKMKPISNNIATLRNDEKIQSEFSKAAVIQEIEQRNRFTTRKRIKDMAKAEVGKSDLDRLAETIQSSIKKDTNENATADPKKESSDA